MVQWKEFWQYQKHKTTKNYLSKETEDRLIFMGLNTGVKPAFGLDTARHGSQNLNGLLDAVEITLLKEALHCRRFDRPNSKTRDI